MIAKLANLSETEVNVLIDAIPLITVLIAGADGEIDPTETEWAEKLTKIRQYDYSSELNEYYKKVGEGYSDRLVSLIDELPGDTERRKDDISEKLAALNPILGKLDKIFATNLIESFRTFAQHVARASGGFLGFASVNKEEARLMKLEMINSIQEEL